MRPFQRQVRPVVERQLLAGHDQGNRRIFWFQVTFFTERWLLADSTLWASFPIAAVCHEFKNQAPINSKEPIMEAREHREA